jgi:hypothetical protein
VYGHGIANLQVDDGEAPDAVKHDADDVTYHFTRRRVFDTKGTQPYHVRSSLKIHCYDLRNIITDTVAISRSKPYDKLHNARMSIRDPYIVLFQNRHRLVKAAGSVDGHGPQCLQSLLDFLKTERPLTWAKLDELEHDRCREISYEDAWLLYSPGTIVYQKEKGHFRAYKVEWVSAQCPPEPLSLCLKVHYLHFDDTGTKLLPKTKQLSMAPYSGSRSIRDLSIVPESHFRQDKVRDELIDRGNQYWGFRGKPSYLEHTGAAWPTSMTNVSTSARRQSRFC